MRKIVEQNLPSDPESAEEQAIYTWQKDEIAFYFCSIFKDVFEVQFTGERWLIQSRWGNDSKIYQYRYINSSSPSDLHYRGEKGISHGNEEIFYTTKEEAIEEGLRYIESELNEAVKEHDKNLAKIMGYAEGLKLKPIIIR